VGESSQHAQGERHRESSGQKQERSPSTQATAEPKQPEADHLRVDPVRQWVVQHWVPLGSAVIALCSLTLSLYQMHASRSQARRLYQPHFAISFEGEGSLAGWLLSNAGMGTARIRGFKLIVDGQPQLRHLCIKVSGPLSATPAQTNLFRFPQKRRQAVGRCKQS
jgi:hypothetical protein